MIALVTVAGMLSALPGAATGSPATGATPAGASAAADPQPIWNSGNLCSPSGINTSTVTCVSWYHWGHPVLWYNFSAYEQTGGVVNIWIFGSHECIYLNFHSFDTTVNIHLLGSDYSCASSSGSGGGGGGWSPIVQWGHQGGCSGGHGWGSGWFLPEWFHKGGNSCPVGVNIAVNSEGDTVNLIQSGSNYATNVTVYGTTTVVNVYQGTRDCWNENGNYLNTTIIYIGTKPGFSTCPSGITFDRVKWSILARGSHDTFNTIFVDGTNVHSLPANSGYATVPLLPVDGGLGYHDLYGSETTTTAPAGSCQYLLP